MNEMANKPTISILIPTAGRDTILYCIHTLSQQELIDGDEILFIGDGPQKEVEQQIEALGPPFRYVEGPHTNDWGHSQINLGLTLARADFIMTTDDDDGYYPRAIESVRAKLTSPGPHLFRFVTNDRILVWRSVDHGFVGESLLGGHNIVLPNIPGCRGEGQWTERYRGDYDWTKTVMESHAKRNWRWHAEILQHQRPERNINYWAVRTDVQFEALRLIRNECRETMTRDTRVITPEKQADFADSVRSGGAIWPFLFSIRDEQPFAYVGYMLLRRIDGKMWVSYGLGEKYRGRGLARHIFRFAYDAAMEDVYAEVLETNTASLHVHKELGWINDESRDGIEYLRRPYPPT